MREKWERKEREEEIFRLRGEIARNKNTGAYRSVQKRNFVLA